MVMIRILNFGARASRSKKPEPLPTLPIARLDPVILPVMARAGGRDGGRAGDHDPADRHRFAASSPAIEAFGHSRPDFFDG